MVFARICILDELVMIPACACLRASIGVCVCVCVCVCVGTDVCELQRSLKSLNPALKRGRGGDITPTLGKNDVQKSRSVIYCTS